MSIIVGKRTFDQKFSQMMLSDFPLESLYRTKMVLNEHNALNRNFYVQPSQSALNENAQILRQHFPRLDDKELFTVLDDCDNNLEIAIEVLQKSTQPRAASPQLVPVQGRAIRKIQSIKVTQAQENIPIVIKEEKRPDTSIQEEEPLQPNKTLEFKELAENIINQLHTMNTLDEAKHMMANILFDVKSTSEKKDQDLIRKLQQEKAILMKAFNKQRQKALESEGKNEELNVMVNNHEQENLRLKTLNYTLGLRLRSLDVSQGDNHNFDVY